MAVHSKYINQFTANEIPVGDINGLNTVFELANTPQSNSVNVRLSGLVQVPGATKDYILSDKIITFAKAPKIGQEVVIDYFY